ncbi:MAG: anti-sigma factor antagonist [bacterium]|jgi:anti-anti-sigma factor|nr:anti-sigma factor antagonist [Solirubrobacteraceae bacterium]
MEIRSTEADGAARLEVTGELDIGTGAQLEDAVTRALDAGARDVVVDLGGTTFLDSSGLGALIRAARAVDAARGTMTVVSPPGSEARVVIDMSRTGGIVGLRDP